MIDRVIREGAGPGIAVIRLNRPEARNAADFATVRALRGMLAEIDADPAIHVVVLAAAGKGFCAGLDLKACVFGDDAAAGATAAMALQELYAGVIPIVRQMRQPVIAAVQGAAVGFGFGLALAADIRLVAPSATFLVGAVKIGLSAGECGISYHLPRLVGAGRAFEIMLTGRAVGAEEAVAIGLASRLVDEAALFDAALATARSIAAHSPYAIKHSKQVMWANLDAGSLAAAIELENHVQTVAMLSEDFREGAAAFAEKRPPRFRDA